MTETALPARIPATGRPQWLALIAGPVALAVLLAVPIAEPSRYIVYLGTLVALNAALATSLNIVIGFAGQFALAHAAFYGLGAYGSALLITRAGFGFWASLPIVLLSIACLALLVGYPSLRLTGGLHFALITFAFGELARLLVANWYDLTGGPMGIRIMYAPEPVGGLDLASAQGLYGLAVAVLLICLGAAALIRHSRFGRALTAIREDEVLAAFLGIDVVWHKVGAFTVSAVLAALAGTIYAPFMSFISPDMLSGTETIALVGVLLVGGIGTLSGPIIGTVIFYAVPEFLRLARVFRLVTLGLVIIATVLLSPGGIVGLLRRLARCSA